MPSFATLLLIAVLHTCRYNSSYETSSKHNVKWSSAIVNKKGKQIGALKINCSAPSPATDLVGINVTPTTWIF